MTHACFEHGEQASLKKKKPWSIAEVMYILCNSLYFMD